MKIVNSASIKDQCAKNYFYGKDTSLERSLQTIEGVFADCVRMIVEGGRVDAQAQHLLRDFSLLQFLRTDIALRRQALAMSQMTDLVFEHSPDQRPQDDFDHVGAAMDSFLTGRNVIADLRTVIVRNETSTPFITSDDPAITFNKFYVQRVRWGRASGLTNSGYCLFLPLTPTLGVLSYDADVYNIFSPGNVAIVRKRSDIDSINEMTAIKCNKNIYFSSLNVQEYVKRIAADTKSKRPKTWHNIHYAILDHEDDQGTRYKVVSTPDERKLGREALIHVEGVQLAPLSWPSFLNYRMKSLAIDTKTGAGFIRRSEAASREIFMES